MKPEVAANGRWGVTLGVEKGPRRTVKRYGSFTDALYAAAGDSYERTASYQILDLNAPCGVCSRAYIDYGHYPDTGVLVGIQTGHCHWFDDSSLTPSQQSAILDSAMEVAMPTQYIPPPSWKDIPQLVNNAEFAKSMARAVELRDAIDTLEKELARIKEDEIETALLGAQVKGRVQYTTMLDGEPSVWEVGVVSRKGTTRLDRKRLVKALTEHGVDPVPIVEAASVKGNDSVYLWLGRAKSASQSPEAEDAD